MVDVIFVIEYNRVTLINTYGTNIDSPQFSPQFYEIVRDLLLEFDNEYFILCIDYNLALNPSRETYKLYIIVV